VLTRDNDLDELGKRRCLMVLSVLSGQRPVTDVIEEAKISRQAYYQLEERAIQGMLMELGLASGRGMVEETKQANRTIEKLNKEVAKLQEAKRRLERLLLVTRKVVKTGPMTLAKKGPRKRRSPVSTQDGTTNSYSSTTKTPEPASTTPSSPLTPTKDSGEERLSGTKN
jgi:hypothetical protein